MQGWLDMNLFLIGFRCTGKTTVAKALAEKTGFSCVDSDRMIETKQNQSVQQIVAKGGWAAFRALEKTAIAAICHRKNQIVSTGGGVVLDGENVAAIRNCGKTIWLTAEPETIFKRMTGDAATKELRPSLTDLTLLEEIRNTLAKRLPLYQSCADFTIPTDNLPVDRIVRQISGFHVISG